MTMYLSNQTVRSTGYELVEFIDVPPVPDDADLTPLCLSPDDEQEVSSTGDFAADVNALLDGASR